MSEPNGNLKRQALGGAGWGVARFGSEQVFRFVIFMFLARMLSPRDFGIFALASIFVDVGKVITSAGLQETLIRSEKADDELANTMFTWSLLLSIIVAAGLSIASIPLAVFLKQPSVAPVIVALALCLLFTPLAVVHNARATRSFKNKTLTGIALTANFTSGAATVVAAYQGLGIWSFVISQVVYGVVGTVLAWVYFPWMPRLKGFSRRRLREVAGFGGNMMLAQLLYISIARAQDFISGRFLGPAILGQMRVAGRVFEVIQMALVAPMAAMALPTLSRLQDDNKRFKSAYSRMLALASLITCPASLGFAAVAPDALPLLFGQQWVQAVPIVQIIGLAAPISVLASFAGPSLTALGRADTVVRFAWLQLVTVLIVSVWAVQYGVIALAIVGVVRSYLVTPIQLKLFGKATGMTTWEVLRNVMPSTVASFMMAGVIWLIQPAVGGWISEPILRLMFLVPLGVLLYGAILFILWRPFMMDQIEGVRSALNERHA